MFSPFIYLLPPTTKVRRYCFATVCLSVCLSVCVFVNNFPTTILVVEWWNFQGLIAMLRSGSDSFLKGQGQDRAKGQIHLIGYRDFKLGSYFSLWKAARNMTLTFDLDLDLEKFAQGQYVWNISVKETAKGEGESRPKCQIQNVNVKVKVEQKVKFT